MTNEVKKAENTAVVPFEDYDRMARAIYASKMTGAQSKEQILTIMLMAQANNQHPVQAIQEYDFIPTKGGIKPSMKAEVMLAKLQKSGGHIEWLELTDKVAKAKIIAPNGDSMVYEYTYVEAKESGIINSKYGIKDNWKKHPKEMLKARLLSNGIRAIAPSVLMGSYTPDEVEEIRESPNYDGSIDLSAKDTDNSTIDTTATTISKQQEKFMTHINALAERLASLGDNEFFVKMWGKYSADYNTTADVDDEAVQQEIISTLNSRIEVLTGTGNKDGKE